MIGQEVVAVPATLTQHRSACRCRLPGTFIVLIDGRKHRRRVAGAHPPTATPRRPRRRPLDHQRGSEHCAAPISVPWPPRFYSERGRGRDREPFARATSRPADVSGKRAVADLTQLRTDVDEALWTRRFLDYWESSAWAHEATPVVEAIGAATGRFTIRGTPRADRTGHWIMWSR